MTRKVEVERKDNIVTITCIKNKLAKQIEKGLIKQLKEQGEW